MKSKLLADKDHFRNHNPSDTKVFLELIMNQAHGPLEGNHCDDDHANYLDI